MHVLLAGLALLAPARPDTDLVATVRDALHVGGPTWKSTILSGTASYYSEKHTFTLQFEPDTKFLQVLKGPLGESFGYDGNSFWQADRSGAPRVLNFEDADVQRAFILAQTDAWLNPPPGVTVTSVGQEIHIKLASGLEETLHIDPATHLPTTATYDISPGTITIKMSDWRPAGSVKIPFKTEVNAAGLTDTFIATEAKEVESTNYSVPTWIPNNITFDTSMTPNLDVKKLPTGHIAVHPLINGKDIGWFILDSGADIFVIDPAAADQLQLPKVGMLPLVGVGGIEKEPFRIVDEMKLGPVTLKDVDCAELDLSVFKKIFKIDVTGIVGFDLFRRSIVKVDLNKPAVSLYDPATFTLSEGAWTQSLFSTGNIAVKAKMEGDREGWYRLDTGADGTVQFHAPYVRKEHLLDNRKVGDIQEAGAGGVSAAKIGKIEWFELAGHRYFNPDATFSLATIGAFNDAYLAGNIGQGFLKAFTLYFDFGGSRVALVPLP